MKLPTQDTRAYSVISPQKLVDYLKDRGWQETEKLDDKAVILELTNKESKFSILLPLSSSLSDYNYRMYEAFRVLEVTENRSQLELLNDFIDPRLIAIEDQREIINLRLESNNFGNETSAKHVGIILESVQGLLDAIGSSVSQGDLFGNQRTKIVQDVIDKTKISILGTFRGSFGIRLALAPQGQIGLIEPSLGCRAIEEFMSIISSSQSKNYSDLASKLTVLQKRSVQKFRKFLFALFDSNINVAIEWGSPFPNKGSSSILTFNNALEVINFINELDFSDIETYELVGELIGVNKRNKKFEVLTFEGEKITGTIEPDLFNGKNIDMTVGKIYRIIIEETTLIDKSQNEKNLKKLIYISPH